jgi:hypothetical protein
MSTTTAPVTTHTEPDFVTASCEVAVGLLALVRTALEG